MTSSTPRRTPASPDDTGRLAAIVTGGAAAVLFAYEAVKTVALPHLTLWGSHAITIAVGSVAAGVAARWALRQQAALHGEVLSHMAARHDAEARDSAVRHSEVQYRQLVERSPEAVIVHRAGIVLYANPAHLTLVGATKLVSVIGRPLITWLAEEDRARFAARLAAFEDAADGAQAPAGGAEPTRYRFRAVDGTWREVDVVSARTTHDGLPATLTVLRDTTAQVLAERERARAHALLEATLDATADAILVVDRSGRLVRYNQQLLGMWGLPAALAASGDTRAIIGHASAQLADPAAFTEQLHVVASNSAESFDDVLEFADGRIIERHSHPQQLAGEVVGRVFSFRDVTMRRRLEAQLAYQAFHDALTGLANRALFQDRVAHALARVQRDPSARQRMAVLLVDLDHFKTINDSLGHGAGDALLITVARRLLGATRGSDTVARLGGDEFAVLLEDMSNPNDACLAAERVLRALTAPVLLDASEAATRSVTVGASVGIAWAATAETPDALVRNADLALYSAKGGGRGRVAAFTPAMHEAAVARLELEADLRASVAELGEEGRGPAGRPGFSVVYQPIVDLATERVTGVEALLRWTRPSGETVSPAVFVPVAEETGLIVALGCWVLGEACRQAVAWEALGPQAHVAVSVNVSGRQLQEASFVGNVARALDATGLAPRRLVLEITEGVMMRDAEQTLARLRALKALGVRIAIDDFGTGYSSLGYLRQFPVDVLKIDKSFVDGVGHGGDESVLATAIVSLGAALALTTVAEGIEDEAQLSRLRALGCQRGQGYLFARPLLAAAVAERLVPGAARAVAGAL